jgi:hypothetical protein
MAALPGAFRGLMAGISEFYASVFIEHLIVDQRIAAAAVQAGSLVLLVGEIKARRQCPAAPFMLNAAADTHTR